MMTLLIALIIGYVLGSFAFSSIILPPFWAWPRASALARQGRLTKPIPITHFLAAPLVWSSLITVSLLLTYNFLPSALDGYVAGLVAAAGQMVWLVFRPTAAMQADFADTYGANLTRPEPDKASGLAKAEALMQAGRYEEAFRCYESAARADPGSWAALEGKGLALHSLQRFEEAVECFARAAEVGRHAHHHSWAWNYQATSLRRLGRFQDALECCDKAINAAPTESGFWVTKGNVLRDLQRFEDALTCHSRAISIWPQNPAAWHNRALVEDDLGRAQDAVAAYKSFLGLVPIDAPGVRHARDRLRSLGG